MVALLRVSVVLALGAVLLRTASADSATGATTIYFWSDRGQPSLFAMRPDGSGTHAVYETRQNAKRPVPSPDGTWIAFDGAAPGKPAMSDFDVQVVRVDGTGRRTLAGSSGFELDAQWSPDGTRLSYSRQPTRDWRRSWIWTVRADGRDARRVARGQFARWAPDGTRIVLDAPTRDSDGDLFVVDAGARVLRRLTETTALEQAAAWSPDGTKILFTRFAFTGEGADVFVMRADGSDERRLTRSDGEDVAAAWSPDGRRILFTSERTGREQVFVMNADGSRQRNLSRSRFADVATSWGRAGA
jgi:TolB protein